MKFLRYQAFNIALIAASLVALLLAIKSSEDPVPKFFSETWVESTFQQFSTGNQLVFDLSIGLISGVLLYYLVVAFPEYRRKQRIRRHLMWAFLSFKKNCIAIYLSALQGSHTSDEVDLLIEPRKFRDYFKEPYVAGQTRWDGVANALYEQHRLSWLTEELALFERELLGFIGLFDMRDEESFGVINSLARNIARTKGSSPDYDAIKSLMSLLWFVHTGWNFIDAYKRENFIVEAIEKI